MTPELSQSPKQLSTIKIPDSDITEAIETTKNEPSVGEMLSYCKQKGRDKKTIETTNDPKHIDYLIKLTQLWIKNGTMSQKDKNLNNNIKNFEKATVEKDKYLSGWDLYKQLLSNKNLSEKNLIELAKVFKGVSSLSNIYQHPNTKKEVKQYIKQNIKEHLNFTIDLYNMINSSEKKEDIKQITKQMTNGNHMDIKALITIKYGINQLTSGKFENLFKETIYTTTKEYREYKNPGKNRETEKPTDGSIEQNEALFKKLVEKERGKID